jgi:hypothetical protein
MWSKEGYMAVKLDMNKAYDRVEWFFLEKVMKRMGFAGRWINLIMMCVRSANYVVLINGSPMGRIFPTRGLRQGDPISPYLLLICIEAFSALLTQANQKGLLRGVPTSKKGPCLNHLFFADDSLLFCRADITHWNKMTKILSIYERLLGQRLNKSKTAIFFNKNTLSARKEQILAVSELSCLQRFDTYLGLSALVGKSRTKAFKGIKDRIWKQLQDWKIKFLSQAGKEILIKAVIQAIPTYSIGVFRLPKTLCLEINALMQKFWWEHQENDKRIHWMSWEKRGLSKVNGGMGFRDLTHFNMALLAKQFWRIWKTTDSLTTRIFKAKYFPNCSILEAGLGSKPSFAWRSIQGAGELVKEGLIWRIGDGASVRIWGEKWIPLPQTFKIQSPPTSLSKNEYMQRLIDPTTKWWNTVLLSSTFN